MNRRVYYVGNFAYPNGNAAGKRVFSNVKLLQKIGFTVVVVGFAKNKEEKKIKDASNIDKKENVYYFSNYGIVKLVLMQNKQFNQVKNIILKNRDECIQDYVIYYGTPSTSFFIANLIKFCKNSNIKIISDCVDWLTVRTQNPIFNLIKNFDNYYLKVHLNKKTDGMIVISEYLRNYYLSVGYPVIKIPPLSINNNSKNIVKTNEVLNLVYAGQLFRKNEKNKNVVFLKDRIDIVIDALALLKQNKIDFVFNIFGFTKSDYTKALPKQKSVVEYLSDNIIFHGLKDNLIVQSYLYTTDFMILIRSKSKESNFGFPTKISESISCGTPVITTDTSDLKEYIIEGVHGFFVDFGVNHLYKKLFELSKLNKSEKYKLKLNCLQSGNFEIMKYAEIVSDFFEKLY